MDKKNIVVKSNSLIEAKYQLSVNEQKFILLIISKLDSTQQSQFNVQYIPMAELKEFFIGDSRWGSPRQYFDDLMDRLASKKLNIQQEDGGWLITHWIASCRFIPKDDVLKVTFSEDLAPYLLQLKKRFTKYDLDNVLQLKHSHSIRLYEILMLNKFKEQKEHVYTLVALREMLGVNDKYPAYKDFKRYILVRAQKELATKSDLTFDFREIKQGRKVYSIAFYVKTKEAEAPKEPNLSKFSPKQAQIFNQIEKWGITKATFLDCLKERSTQHLEDCIQIVLSKKAIKDKAAYFIKLAKEEKIVNSPAAKKQEAKAKRAQLNNAKEEQKAKERLLEAQKAKRYQAEQVLVRQLLKDPSFVESVKIELLKTNFARYDRGLSFEENLKKRPVKVLVHSIVLKLKPEAFINID